MRRQGSGGERLRGYDSRLRQAVMGDAAPMDLGCALEDEKKKQIEPTEPKGWMAGGGVGGREEEQQGFPGSSQGPWGQMVLFTEQ